MTTGRINQVATIKNRIIEVFIVSRHCHLLDEYAGQKVVPCSNTERYWLLGYLGGGNTLHHGKAYNFITSTH